MALTGEAKKEYQKEYMRKQRSNQVRPTEITVRPVLDPTVRPNGKFSIQAITPELEKAGLKLNGNRILDALKSKSSPLKPETRGKLPLYNRFAPQIGERVIMPSGDIVTVPELDADGNTIESYSPGKSSSFNEFKPSFSPHLKPEKKKR